MKDIVRLYRIIEYKGNRDVVEDVVNGSIHGTKKIRSLSITAQTIGEFPDLIESPFDEREESYMRKILTSRKTELPATMDYLEENSMLGILLDKLYKEGE